MKNAVDEAAPYQVEVMLFDAAGTLFHPAEPVWEVYAAVAREFSWRLEARRIETAFRETWSGMPAPDWENAAVDPEREWWRLLVKRVLTGAGVAEPGPGFAPYFKRLWDHYARAEAWVLYEEVPEVLEILRQRYRLGILSNFDDRLFPVLRGLGIIDLFEAVTISSHAKARKPDPAIFHEALRAHRIGPRQGLHVGDEREADWVGARNAGMASFELDRARNSLRSLLAFPYIC